MLSGRTSSSSSSLASSSSSSKLSKKSSASSSKSPKGSRSPKSSKSPKSSRSPKSSKSPKGSRSPKDSKAAAAASSGKKGKVKVKVRYRVTIREAENLPKRAKGKFVYIAWKRGSKADNKGETRYALYSGSGTVAWNESFEIVSSLIRDEATGTFKTKSKKLVFRVMLAGDNTTERKKKDKDKDKDKTKKDAPADGDAAEDKKKKKLSGAQRHKLRTEHKEFASIYIDLVEYAKDGTNVQEDLALNSTDPPAALSLRVESTWLKVGKHALKRLDNKPGSSSSAASSSKDAGSGGSDGSVIPVGGGADPTAAVKRTENIDGNYYELESVMESSDSDDCTTMPTMTGMGSDDDDEGTQDDFSDEDDPFADPSNDVDARTGGGLTLSMSDSRLSARRGSIGTASESGASPAMGAGKGDGGGKALKKTTSATNVTAKLRRLKKLPLVPKNLDAPKIAKPSLDELCDAVHYVVFLPIENVWGLQHSPQDLLALLRSALGLTQDGQERSLDRVLPSCNYENTLVLLDRQLHGVTKHRFYAQESFASPDLFRGWKDAETARIQRLIDRIYKNIDGIEPIAAPGAPYEQFGAYDFHQLYRLLNKALHYYDSALNKKINHEVFVLSGASTWLLKEFGERYQVNPLFRSLSMLDLLISYWCPSPPRLMLLQILLMKIEQMLGVERLDAWLGVATSGGGGGGASSSSSAAAGNADDDAGETPLAPANAGKAYLTKAEKAFLASLLGDLDGRLAESYGEFFVFSTDAQSSPIKSMGQILATAIQLEGTIGLPERSSDELIYDWVREGLSHMYDKMVQTAAGRSGGGGGGGGSESGDDETPLTVAQMCRVSEMVIEGLHTLADYGPLFPFELASLGARGFVKWYHEDLVSLCTASGAAGQRSAKQMIELAGTARNVGAELTKAAPNISIPVNLAPLFDPFVNGYLLETLNEQRSHVDAVVNDDKWTPTSDDLQCSTCLQPTLASLSAPLAFISKYDFLGAGTFETRFGSYVVDPVVSYYLQQLYRSLVAALPGSTSKIALRMCDAVPPADLIRATGDLSALLARLAKIRGDVSVVDGSVKPQLAVRVNTIAAVAACAADYFTIPDTANEVFSSTVASVVANAERYAAAVVVLLACWICTDVLRDVKALLKKASKSSVEGVRHSLSVYMQGLSPVLVGRNALALLQALWRCLLVAVKDTVVASGKTKPKHIEKLRAGTDALLDIVGHAGASYGLESAALHAQLGELYSELEHLQRK